jgi:hypothetical protein
MGSLSPARTVEKYYLPKVRFKVGQGPPLFVTPNTKQLQSNPLKRLRASTAACAVTAR